MERTLSVVLAVLAAVTIVFLAIFSLSAYAALAYRATFAGTYEYRVSISSDTDLGNVTLYIPIPARGAASSEILERIGSGGLEGLPLGWAISLIGTEKFTMLEVTTPGLAATPVGEPYLLSADARTGSTIDTRNPETGGLVLEPGAGLTSISCGNIDPQASPEMRCVLYRGSVYADFTSVRDPHLTIFTFVAGRNNWDVFGPSSNEYQDGLQATYVRDIRGWRLGDGILVSGVGDYSLDFWLPGEGSPGAGPAGSSFQAAWWPLALRGTSA
ncbi:MAG TPA: hypothetical protein VMB35_00230 [Methanomicrobiales archaeon]|nr:hypothetical protein [Methanomicrobiales archaeon]